MTGVRRALAFSLAERYLLLVISLGSNMAIARLLTPEAIGIFSVSLAFIGIAQVLRDFGVANYLIQERELTEDHVRTAFGVLLVLGGAVCAALLLLAPWIAQAYGEPAMVLTLRVCALNFLVLPFCTVSLALLRRAMAFQRLTVVNFVAAAVGAAVSVGMAWGGYGVLSLAIGSVIVNVVTGLGAWLAREDLRLLLPAFTEWRRVLNFGAQSSLSGVVTSVSMDINDLAVGKVMGFEPVAILSRAQGLMNLFHRDVMSAIRNVAYPAYARAHREQQDMESAYITSVTHVTVIAWPFYGFVSLYSLEILRLMFGAQWDAAAPLVPVFCLAGALAAMGNLVAPLVLAVGRVDLVTKVELVFQPFRAALIVIAAVWLQSTMACAVALVLAMLIQLPLLAWVKARCVPSDLPRMASGLRISATVSVCSLALPASLAWWARSTTSQGPDWWVFGAAALCCGGAWLAALIALKHPLADDPAVHRVLVALRLRRPLGE